MTRIMLLLAFWAINIVPVIALAAEPAEKHKASSNQGMTLEEVGRGLQSAAKNIGDEIPKIGPAIADTFRKVTHSDKESENSKDKQAQSSKPQSKDKK